MRALSVPIPPQCGAYSEFGTPLRRQYLIVGVHQRE